MRRAAAGRSSAGRSSAGRGGAGRRAVLAGLALAALPAAAPAEAVDLQLVLAVDASGSVTPERFALQREGYAAAFRHPRVLAAIAGGAAGRIAVAMVQWTGPALHVLAVDWTGVHDRASADALAEAIARAPRRLFGGGTSISGAIDYGRALFARTALRAERRVIDISGDGPNNAGRLAGTARDEAVAAGITINGLPILAIDPGLDDHYRDEVIGGPGAFLVAIDAYEQFADAILHKLVSEIARRDLPAGVAG